MSKATIISNKISQAKALVVGVRGRKRRDMMDNYCGLLVEI